MVMLRFMLVVVAITLAIGLFGCSQGPGRDSAPTADDRNDQTPAEGPNQAKSQGQWWKNESIVAELELTAEQAQAIDDLMAVSAGDANQARQRERRLSLRYLRALGQDPYDPDLVDRVGEQLNGVFATTNSRRLENIRAIRDVLTYDQWTKLWELAPKALQIGGFKMVRGPRIQITDSEVPPTPTPMP